MKKQFILLLLLLSPFLIKAQENNFRLGLTATPTFGWMRFNDNSDLKSDGLRTGFSYGISGDFGFSKNYYFGTAFTLTTINSNVNVASNTTSGTIIYKIQYIDIPLTLKLKSNPINNTRVYGQFGLGTGIKISDKNKSELKTIQDAPQLQPNSDVNLFRLSMIIGGGAEWDLVRTL